LGHPEPWHQRQLHRRHSAAIQGVVVVHAATPCSVLTVFWMPSMVTQREPRQDLCDSIHHKLPSKSLRRHMKRGVIFICSLSLWPIGRTIFLFVLTKERRGSKLDRALHNSAFQPNTHQYTCTLPAPVPFKITMARQAFFLIIFTISSVYVF
jgi:hypothetical protein